MANSLVTPHSIVPEWYLLPFYAILRAIPSKLGGVIAMLGALLILLPLSFLSTYNLRSNRYRPLLQFLFWVFAFNFLFLLWLGAKPIAEPFIILVLMIGCAF
jgi:ubiquinol-cytochrome c reductase cytochrome b subunit